MNNASNRAAPGEAATEASVREVVGVFDTAALLDDAVEQLGVNGIDLAAISVLGVDGTRHAGAAGARRSAWAASDDPSTPRAVFVSAGTRAEAKGVTIGLPMEIAGFAAAWAVGAAGGALLLGIAAVAASGAVGAGLGALLYHVVAGRHAASIADQLAAGGLILWVQVPDPATEDRVTATLRACGANSVHAHLSVPPADKLTAAFRTFQPDPFLERDPGA